MEFRYEKMTPDVFIQAIEKLPVFIIPTGLLEWHGDHLPLGLDSLKSYGICLKLAKELNGGIVLPPQYVGRPGFSRYTGTLTFSEGLVNQYFYELMGQLKKVGAKVIVLMTGHYGPLQVDAIKRVAECFAVENPQIKVVAQPEYEDILIDGNIPADHAAMWETSMYMYLYNNNLKIEQKHLTPKPMMIYSNPENDYYKEKNEWWWPNNLLASNAQLGEKAVNEIIKNLKKKIMALINEGN